MMTRDATITMTFRKSPNPRSKRLALEVSIDSLENQRVRSPQHQALHGKTNLSLLTEPLLTGLMPIIEAGIEYQNKKLVQVCMD